MTILTPEPSSCQSFAARQDCDISGDCHTPSEDNAVCQSSEAPEVCLPTVTSASENAGNVNVQSDEPATNSNSQQLEIAASDVADGTVYGSDSRHVCIDDLQDEIMLKIFSHMSFTELVDVIQKVSSRWKRLSHDFTLWADKEYLAKFGASFDLGTRKSGRTGRQAIQTFLEAPSLLKVRLYRCAKSSVFRALYNNCHRLSELHLYHAQKLRYSVLKNLVEKCPRIHTLCISNKILESGKFSETVSRLQHLRVLILETDFLDEPPVLRPLADGCPRLAEVDFTFTSVEMGDLKYFLYAKRNTLKSIGILWSMDEGECVFPLLTVCANSLERLELYTFNMDDREAREAFNGIGSLKNLEELRMRSIGVLLPGTIALAFKNGGLPKLRVLNLREGFGLEDDTVIAISRGCPALQELVLRNAQRLSDAAFSEIHRLKNLKKLDVSSCSGLGGALIPRIAKLPQLHELIMEDMDFPKLQPGVSSILQLPAIHRLILDFSDVTGVPFDKFPENLTCLRELHVQECEGDFTAIDELALRMPDLELYSCMEDEEEEEEALDLHNHKSVEEENAGPGNEDKARDDSSESDCDSIDSESSNNIWDETSISAIFLEDT